MLQSPVIPENFLARVLARKKIYPESDLVSFLKKKRKSDSASARSAGGLTLVRNDEIFKWGNE
jgi:hypothetical protein